MKQYMEMIVDPKIRAKYKMGETRPPLFQEKEIPEWMKKWLDSAYYSNYGANANYSSIQNIEDDVIKNRIESPVGRVVVLNNGDFYSSKTGALVHNHILAYLMYKGIISPDEKNFKEWRSNKNVAVSVPFVMMQPKSNYLCISESYYLKSGGELLNAIANMITKKGNKFEKGLKATGLSLCPFGVDTPEAAEFIKDKK